MLSENLIKLYESSFRNNWNHIALSDYFKDDTFTYGQMAEEIARLHLLFEQLKIKKGDKISLIGRNNTRWCITYIATITYGAVIVPILQDFNPNDVQHIINHSDSVLLFAGEMYWESIEESKVKNIRAVISLEDFSPLYERTGKTVSDFFLQANKLMKKRYPKGFTPADIKYSDRKSNDVVLINYTSGTTGFSKGVMLTVNNLTGNILLGIRTSLHFPGSRALSFLPLAHAYGCMFDFLMPLCVGTHITLLGKIPSPKVLLDALAKVKPHLINCVPLILEKVYRKQILPQLDKPLLKLITKVPILDAVVYMSIKNKLVNAFGGELEQIIIGGAPLNKEVEEFLYKINFPFTVGYGMTECGPLISYTHWKEFVPTSCGKVLDGLMEVKIDSPDPYKIPGEIRVRGEHVMAGYYKNPEASNAVLRDGWLYTGDMGTISSDETIFIRGRCKTMILGNSGQNIYPEEIEAKLNNMPCVMESLVVEREGKLVALVYPDYEQADAQGIRTHQIEELMEKNRIELNTLVAPYERIQSVVLYPHEFEKTPKRSIKRYLYTV